MGRPLVMGVDPAFRTCGYFLGQPGTGSKGGMVHLASGVIDGGNTTNWIWHMAPILDSLREVIEKHGRPNLVGVENIVWYGKRKGSLALAHLAGAIYGYLHSLGCAVVLYNPRDVKARSAMVRLKFPTDHERDAFALAKMVYEEYGGDAELAT